MIWAAIAVADFVLLGYLSVIILEGRESTLVTRTARLAMRLQRRKPSLLAYKSERLLAADNTCITEPPRDNAIDVPSDEPGLPRERLRVSQAAINSRQRTVNNDSTLLIGFAVDKQRLRMG
eukprot:5140283-Amphidinium_carterae.1